MEQLETQSYSTWQGDGSPAHKESADWQALLLSAVENSSAVVFLKDPQGRYLLASPGFVELLQLRTDEVVGRTDGELFPPAVAESLRSSDLKVLAAGRALEFEEIVTGPDGPRVSIVTKFPVKVSGYPSGSVGGIATNITQLKRSEGLLAAEKRVLQLIARGAPLATILEGICGMVEGQAPEVLSSVLLLDQDTRRLHHGAAPSLPEAYNRAVDGIEIGPSVGSCGTAAFRGQSVEVTDIETDPLWANFRDVALGHGLRACWSMPIFSAAGSVLGTIALYSRQIHAPTGEETLLLGRAAALAGIAMERQRSEEALQRTAADYRLLVESASDGIFTFDRNRRLTQANPRVCEMLGYSHAEILGLDLNDVLGDASRDSAVGDLAGPADHRASRVEWSFQRKDGTRFLGAVSAVVLPNENTQAIVRDITEQRQRESDRLKQEADLARTDALTGLRNRRSFEEQSEQHFCLAVRHKLAVVLALLDLDRFKQVNDTLGHAEGDRVLREIGAVLSRVIRTSDVVARIGGDEFGFVLVGVSEANAHIFFARLLRQLDERMRAWNWPVGFSIGVAACSQRPPTRDIAMAHADKLLYSAKRAGGNRFIIGECV